MAADPKDPGFDIPDILIRRPGDIASAPVKKARKKVEPVWRDKNYEAWKKVNDAEKKAKAKVRLAELRERKKLEER